MSTSFETETSWTPEERDRFLKSLLDDDKYETPLLAESIDEMDPDMVAALVALRDGDDPPSVLAEAAKDRGNKHFSTARKTKKTMWYKEAAKEYTDGISLCQAAADSEASRPYVSVLLVLLVEHCADGRLSLCFVRIAPRVLWRWATMETYVYVL